jgi:hypothetical protein
MLVLKTAVESCELKSKLNSVEKLSSDDVLFFLQEKKMLESDLEYFKGVMPELSGTVTVDDSVKKDVRSNVKECSVESSLLNLSYGPIVEDLDYVTTRINELDELLEAGEYDGHNAF